jgi:hypothetical protein
VILNTLIFLIHLGQLFEVCSQNSTIDFKSVPRGSEPWHLINLNILKFVHKILLTFKMEVVELVILNTLIFWSTSVNFLKFIHKILLYISNRCQEGPNPDTWSTSVNISKFVHKILLKLKMEVVELVILNTLIFLIHVGQFFEVCSQNPTIYFKSVSWGSKPWHMIHLNQYFEVCSQNSTKIENGSCRSRDSEHSHFLIHVGQFLEVCSQNPTIDFKSVSWGSEPWHMIYICQFFEVCSQNATKIENGSCRARHSEHIDFLIHVGQLFEVCSQNPTIYLKSVSGGA